jgi:hypothetical protein
LSPDSFRAGRMLVTDGVGQELAFSWWRTHRKRYLLGDFGSIASTISPARSGSKLRACHQPPAEDRAACVRSIRFFPTDELGNLLDHLFFNAGIAVLGKGAARIGGHRMTMLERAARFAG